VSGQLPLALGLRPRVRLDDWIPGANAGVLAAARALLAGRERQLFVSGPPGSGRSHLLLGLCDAAERQGQQVGYLPLAETADLSVKLLEGLEQLDLLAVDDVQALAGRAEWELALFNLYNRARDRQVRLVFAAAAGPAALPLRLADLRTRLAWGLSFQLLPLDDAGRLTFLHHEAGHRGLALPEEAARHILRHCPRDLPSLRDVVERLDRAALAAQRRLTLPFVREQLRRAGDAD
jgi:DnaA family protein